MEKVVSKMEGGLKMQVIALFIFFLFAGLTSCGQKQSTVAGNTKLVENLKPTKDQSERRKLSEAFWIQYNIPVYRNPNSLFVDPEDKVTLRTKEDVTDRALALYYIGLKSEGLDKKLLGQLDKDYHILSKMSPTEKAYAIAENPTDQQKTNASWRYESLHVMLWALEFIDSLGFPAKFCNVAQDVKIIHDLSPQQFRQKAKLRSKKEILDQADLALRIDWACVNARVKNEKSPANLDNGIVLERHYSFNWLIRYMNEDWDDVSTDT